MTPMQPEDPLVILWQTASSPTPHDLTKEIEHSNRLHRLSDRSIVAILWCMAILIVFEETTGRLTSHGMLSTFWISALVVGLRWRRRAQCTRLDALTSDTVSLLKFMVRQAKRDLFLARCLYAGVPAGAAIAWLVMKLADSAAVPSAVPNLPKLHLIQTSAGVAVLFMMMLTGVILSRSRVLQVKALTKQLHMMEDDV